MASIQSIVSDQSTDHEYRTSTWIQVTAQTPDISVAFSGNVEHGINTVLSSGKVTHINFALNSSIEYRHQLRP